MTIESIFVQLKLIALILDLFDSFVACSFITEL
jgi:hypothetical protein